MYVDLVSLCVRVRVIWDGHFESLICFGRYHTCMYVEAEKKGRGGSLMKEELCIF